MGIMETQDMLEHPVYNLYCAMLAQCIDDIMKKPSKKSNTSDREMNREEAYNYLCKVGLKWYADEAVKERIKKYGL